MSRTHVSRGLDEPIEIDAAELEGLLDELEASLKRDTPPVRDFAETNTLKDTK